MFQLDETEHREEFYYILGYLGIILSENITHVAACKVRFPESFQVITNFSSLFPKIQLGHNFTRNRNQGVTFVWHNQLCMRVLSF